MKQREVKDIINKAVITLLILFIAFIAFAGVLAFIYLALETVIYIAKDWNLIK